MKHLKTFILACVCAFVVTYTSTVASKPVPLPDFENATVSEVITSETGSCVIVFISDEDKIPVSENDSEKCKSFKPGDMVSF